MPRGLTSLPRRFAAGRGPQGDHAHRIRNSHSSQDQRTDKTKANSQRIQLAAHDGPVDGQPAPQEDFTDLHAWVEIYLSGAGWIGIDSTSGMLAGESHIQLFCPPDATSAAPVSGSGDACETELYFLNRITRLDESRRLSKH